MRDTSAELLCAIEDSEARDESAVLVPFELASAIHKDLCQQSIAISKVKILCDQNERAINMKPGKEPGDAIIKDPTPFIKAIRKVFREELGA